MVTSVILSAVMLVFNCKKQVNKKPAEAGLVWLQI